MNFLFNFLAKTRKYVFAGGLWGAAQVPGRGGGGGGGGKRWTA